MVLPVAPAGCSWVPVIGKIARHVGKHHTLPIAKRMGRKIIHHGSRLGHHIRRAAHHVVHHAATPAAYKLVCVAVGVAIGAGIPTSEVSPGVVQQWPDTPAYIGLPYVQGGGWAYDRGIYASLGRPSYVGGGSWPNVVPPGDHTGGFPSPPPEQIVEPSTLLVFGTATFALLFIFRRRA